MLLGLPDMILKDDYVQHTMVETGLVLPEEKIKMQTLTDRQFRIITEKQL